MNCLPIRRAIPSANATVFDQRAHLEIDRLIIENEQLKEENHDLKSIVVGLLHEIDGVQL
ncbi:MAG: hypothetical protein K1563_07865 [Candidatus Thiodiazotropha sp. (ex. Lucinisca nassula)]|nr:hypothetical protein [Candidatus Thiodiazotropha sp. (ex. Lucinisca nassula)]MBW9273590.1 hypothetical protein [Candidatus Thiodiazotropha sp. (ex. Lucinisca nassula)]